MTLSVRFAPDTFNSSTTVVQFGLDTDTNPATGHPGFDSECPTPGDNGVIGLEYIVNMGSTAYGTQASIRPYAGSCNIFGGEIFTTPGSVTYVSDGMDVTFPLPLISNDDGRLYFKVLTQTFIGPGFTGILDRMSNLGQPPGQVRTTTWNPSDRQAYIQLSADRLEAFEPSSTGSLNDSVRATVGHATGRFYFEATIVAQSGTGYNSVGLATGNLDLENEPANDSVGGCGYWGNFGRCNSTGTSATSSTSGDYYAAGDVIGVAVDLDAGVIYFSRNGAWDLGGDPHAGTGGLSLSPTTGHVYYPVGNISWGDATRANFGASPFVHPVPAGYRAGW